MLLALDKSQIRFIRGWTSESTKIVDQGLTAPVSRGATICSAARQTLRADSDFCFECILIYSLVCWSRLISRMLGTSFPGVLAR